MKDGRKNIYKTSGKNAGITQDEAAYRIGISTRSIIDYETGQTIPKDDIVCAMAELYNSPHLIWQHLKTNTAYSKYLPDIELNSELSRSVLKLQKETNRMVNAQSEIIDIACDGEITHDEAITWDKVRGNLKDLAGAALSLLFTGRKEESPAA